MPYDLEAARLELQRLLDEAPRGAVRGVWSQTAMLSGSASGSGQYFDAIGRPIVERSSEAARAIRAIVQKLEEGGGPSFNRLKVIWAKSKIPFAKGRVEVDLVQDDALTPRSKDDPIYEASAKARRDFWLAQGKVSDEFAADVCDANAHGQTKWFGPHRRVVYVQSELEDILATDGLSTPWPGVAERENGVGCEVALSFPRGELTDEALKSWADLMIGVGDFVADGYDVAREVEESGAIIFCATGDRYEPLNHIILSWTGRTIQGLPFGPAPVLRATAVTDEEVAAAEGDNGWSAPVALEALRRRGLLRTP